jgi:hypothetical protein
VPSKLVNTNQFALPEKTPIRRSVFKNSEVETKYCSTNPKLEKLMEQFLALKKSTPAFQDTFIDKDFFAKLKDERNYAQMCENLFSFILHSSNKQA